VVTQVLALDREASFLAFIPRLSLPVLLTIKELCNSHERNACQFDSCSFCVDLIYRLII
jgi:hypothetical protein